MELPFVRLSLTNEIEEQLTTDEILAQKLREIKLSNNRAKLRLRQNSKLIQPESDCDRVPEVNLNYCKFVEFLRVRRRLGLLSGDKIKVLLKTCTVESSSHFLFSSLVS